MRGRESIDSNRNTDGWYRFHLVFSSVAINGDLIFFSSNIQPDVVVVVAVALSVCLCCLRWSTASVATASITADILVNLCPAVWKTIRARCKKMYIECGSTRARTTPSRWITAFGLVAYSFCACSSIYITVSLLTLSEWIFVFLYFSTVYICWATATWPHGMPHRHVVATTDTHQIIAVHYRLVRLFTSSADNFSLDMSTYCNLG